MKTASRKAKRRIAGQDVGRSSQPKPTKKVGRRVVLNYFPHTKAGRPKIVDDMVGTPI